MNDFSKDEKGIIRRKTGSPIQLLVRKVKQLEREVEMLKKKMELLENSGQNQ